LDIRAGTPVQRADAWITRKHYTEKMLGIQRLSGDLLPMDQCYINLAILETCERSGSAGQGPSATEMTTSPFSLASRLNVDTPISTRQVDIPALFDPRPSPDKQPEEPRRILIRGRAGVGKSTLCKKMVHDFLHGSSRWNTLFTRVLWIPLRRLKQSGRNSAEYSLGTFLHQVFFEHHPKGGELAGALWQAVEEPARGNTLFILDGLDEVSELLDPAQAASGLLYDLLNRPWIVVTTRPHLSLPLDIREPDLEVETIGFYPPQVQSYLRAVTTRSTAEDIEAFLAGRRLIQGLVRIPIQLDALCSTWGDLQSSGVSSTPETMTALYTAIVQQLWKKDVPRLTEALSEYTARTALGEEVERYIASEREILECLAFSGMYSNMVDFGPAHRGAVCQLFPPRRMGFDKTLGCLSFIRTSDTSGPSHHRSYHFLHLTFQEFFAAQYISRRWREGRELGYFDFNSRECRNLSQVSFASFFRRHKYTARYDVVWRFVAGLLQPPDVEYFFHHIEAEPMDLLGPAHQRLVMRCLSEVNRSTKLSLRADLEARLVLWLGYESDTAAWGPLVGESECPDEVRRAALETKQITDARRISILGRMATANVALSATTQDLLLELLRESSNTSVLSAAFTALASQQNVSRSIITPSIIKSLLESNRGEVVLSVTFKAVMNLKRYVEVPEVVAETSVALLRSTNLNFRKRATDALSRQPELPETIVAAICGLLHDSDKNDCGITAAVTTVLATQDKLSEVHTRAIAAYLVTLNPQAEGASNACQNIVKVLLRQSPLSVPVVEALLPLLDHLYFRVDVTTILAHQSSLTDDSCKAVLRQLQSEDEGCRYEVAHTLNQYSLARELVQDISQILGDRNTNIQGTAAFALGGSTLSGTTVESISALLEEHKPAVRLAAVGTLLQQPLSWTLVERILPLLKDSDPSVRKGVTEAVARRWSSSTTRLEVMETLPTTGVSDLNGTATAKDFYTTSLQAVTSLLADNDAEVRRAAYIALTNTSVALPDEVVRAVMLLLEHRDESVRRAAGLVSDTLRLPASAASADSCTARFSSTQVFYRMESPGLVDANLTDPTILDTIAQTHDAAKATRPSHGLRLISGIIAEILQQDMSSLEARFRAQNHNNTADKVFDAIAGLPPESGRTGWTSRGSRREVVLVVALYRVWLYWSGSEQLSLFLDKDEQGNMRMCLNHGSGLRSICVENWDGESAALWRRILRRERCASMPGWDGEDPGVNPEEALWQRIEAEGPSEAAGLYHGPLGKDG